MSRRPVPAHAPLVIAALAGLVACGKRADPLAPYLKTPQPPAALEVSQVGETIELKVIAPRLTTESRPLPVITLEWFEGPAAGDFGKGARPVFQEDVAPGEIRIKSFPLPAAETRFSARALSGKARSTLTVPVAFKPAPIPSPPSGLQATNTATGVALAWVNPPGAEPWPSATPTPSPSPSPGVPPLAGASPAASPSPTPTPSPNPSPSPLLAGVPSPIASPSPGASVSPTPIPLPPTGIRIFRTDGTARLARDPIQASSWLDKNVKAGDKPCYALRYATSFKPLVESASTEPVCIESKDIVPPQAPVRLVADVGATFVELSWTASTSTDIASYRIYASIDGKVRSLILETQGPVVRMRHGSIAPGVRIYDVTAVDTSGNESTPSPVFKVTLP